MTNDQQQQQIIIPHSRTFKIENIPRVKISLSNLEINRIVMPIESISSQKNRNNFNHDNEIDQIPSLPRQKIKVIPTDNQQQIENSPEDAPFWSRRTIQQPIVYPNVAHLSKIEQKLMNVIDNREPAIETHNHDQHLQPSSVIIQEQQVPVVPIHIIDERQPSSSEVVNKADILSSVIQVEQASSSPHSRIIPDSIINDKQAVKRIFNEQNSILITQSSRIVTSTPVITEKKQMIEKMEMNSPQNNDDFSSSNHFRYYQIGSILTSTSTLIMHYNEVIAQANASDPFLSDTIVIILITTLTIIILLFCLGLFCLCRRTTKRNISPSFDGGSYAGLDGHSFEMPIGAYQQRISKYENDSPYMDEITASSIHPKSSINHPPLTNDGILLPQTVALHHTVKQKAKINKRKLKKKRVGFCCCHSQEKTPSTTINGRTRMKRSDM